MSEQDNAGTSQKSEEIHFLARDERRDIINSLFSRAHRSIAVFAPTLDAYTFNASSLAGHLSDFVTRHRSNETRFLIENHRQVTKNNGRLMGITRRFSDFIRFRQLSEEYAGRTDCFIVIDDNDFLFQRDVASPDGLAIYNDRNRAKQYKQQFDDLWQHSTAMIGLNTLGL